MKPRTTIRESVYAKYNMTCQVCGKKVNPKSFFESPELDHVIPKSYGGPDKEENLRLVCRRCNSFRSNIYGQALIDKISTKTRDIYSSDMFNLLAYEYKNGTINNEQLELVIGQLNEICNRLDKIKKPVRVRGL